MAGRQSLKCETILQKTSILHCKRSEIGCISVLGGVRPILVKVVLFQLSGHGHHLDDATPSFFLNSKSPILGLLNDISFVIFFLLKVG